MKTFTAGFTAEKNKKTGTLPIWFLRLPVDGVDYWISDGVYTILPGGPGWPAVDIVTTLSWVAAWGSIRESLGGGLGEILIADFSMTINNDISYGNNIEYLATTHELEKELCQLYLWYDGLDPVTDPPQMMFSGYLSDLDIPDETAINITIEDEGSRLQNYLGEKISREKFPLCDPDVVGKMIPIVFGPVTKLPALCVDAGWVSSIVADIGPSDTLITVSEVPDTSLLGKTITIDDEQMLVTQPTVTSNYTNYAAASQGSTASCQVQVTGPDTNYSPANTINGDRLGLGAHNGGYCYLYLSGGTGWLQVDFGQARTIDQVWVFGAQLNFGTPVSPAEGMITNYAPHTYQVQIWDGAAWVTVANVADNNLVWRKVSFAAVTTTSFRLYITVGSIWAASYCMITEVEASLSTIPTVPTSANSKTISVARGQNGTPAAIHTKGSIVIEKKATPLVYLLTDHPLDAIGTVLARIRGVNVDITADITKYLGTPENQLSAYPGRAAITIPDYARVTQRIALELQGDVTATDALHTHIASTGSSTITNQLDQAIGASVQTSSINLKGVSTNGQWVTFWGDLYWNFVSAGGTILTSTVSAVISCPAGSSIYFGGVLVVSNSPAMSNQQVNHTFNPATEATAMQSNQIRIRMQLCTVAIYSPQVTYNDIRSAQAGCSATRKGTYNTAAPVISIEKVPSGVSVSNTLQLTGNSVSDIMIGDAVLVDCTRNISAPAEVIDTVLTDYCADTSLQLIGTLPAHFRLVGAITEYRPALEWIDSLAFQCGCYFRRIAGVSKLLVRTPVLTSQKNIPACCLDNEGKKKLKRKKAPLTDVINTIELLYCRDWSSENRTAESYTRNAPGTDPISIRDYGVREQPDLFMFDFVIDQQMAADLVTLYLALYGPRHWRVQFTAFLDHCELEFGDVVTLDFQNFMVGQIVEAGISPGDLETIDTIEFTVLTPGIPQEPLNAVITAGSGNAFITTDRRFIIHG